MRPPDKIPTVAVVQGEDAQRAVLALGDRGISSTRISSSGGFLQQGNVTLQQFRTQPTNHVSIR